MIHATLQMVECEETVRGVLYRVTTAASAKWTDRFECRRLGGSCLALFLRRELAAFMPGDKLPWLIPTPVEGSETTATRAKILRALHNLCVECYRTCAASSTQCCRRWLELLLSR